VSGADPEVPVSRRLLISAFGINAGGGLVLLEALLPAVRTALRAVTLDSRLRGRSPQLDPEVARTYVRRRFLARLRSLDRQAREARQGDVLLCFNSLPPLRRTGARVINYVHAPHFIAAHRGIRYAPMTRLRMAIERRWLSLGIRHCDEVWVQTESMARELRAIHPGARVVVVPFVDEALYALLPRSPATPAAADATRFTFFYPADAVGHKNHQNLLAAWQELARENFRPTLKLTLEAGELQAVLARMDGATALLPNVQALGRIGRSEVLEQLRGSSALLFASLTETLGIPLVEAMALGVPVLAAERTFVRDVSRPRETFDPASPRSIADAVRRFMGVERPQACLLSAAEFAARLLG